MQQNPAKGTPSQAARRTQVHKGVSLSTLRWWSHESQAISTATSETLDRPCQEEDRPGPNRKSPPPHFAGSWWGGKSRMLTQGSANTRGEPSCHYKPCGKSHKLAATHGKLDLSPCACATQQRATAQTAQDKPCCNAHTSRLDTRTHAPRGTQRNHSKTPSATLNRDRIKPTKQVLISTADSRPFFLSHEGGGKYGQQHLTDLTANNRS